MLGEENAGANLEQQFADLVFALGSGFVERRELPQVGHVDRGAVSDQQLGHLVVTVRTGVMEGNQATVKRKQQLYTHYYYITAFYKFLLKLSCKS